MYDHGISDEINNLDLAALLKVRIILQAPRDNGLPTNEEAGSLNAIEDELTKEIEALGGACVGRITTDGHRYIYNYVSAPEDQISPIIGRLSSEFEYDVGYLVQNDPEKKGYWEDLFPTRHDWRVMQDSKVIEQLESHGDTLEKERRVDHWAYFSDPGQRQGFESWAKGEGFSVQGVSEPDGDTPQYGIQFFHRCTPTLDQISHYTCLLVDKAEEYGGDYDGWETRVEASDPQGS
jgi:hypothetical protein